jgi:hypothetical protein
MTVLAAVAERTAEASPLWRDSLVARDAEPRFTAVCPPHLELGVEMIYEGHLLHRGRSRLFSQDDADLALLTGDHLYAAGLREICATGDLEAVGALADLISICARDQADGRGDTDEELWQTTVASLR